MDADFQFSFLSRHHLEHIADLEGCTHQDPKLKSKYYFETLTDFYQKIQNARLKMQQ